jgi:hypothetical protein
MCKLAMFCTATAARYELVRPALGSLMNWRFLKFLFAIGHEIVLALGKFRQADFTRHPNTIRHYAVCAACGITSIAALRPNLLALRGAFAQSFVVGLDL